MKSNREIRGYKVKSLPPQRESAWSRRHHLLQSHSELLDPRGALALTGIPPEVEMGVGWGHMGRPGGAGVCFVLESLINASHCSTSNTHTETSKFGGFLCHFVVSCDKGL